MADRPSLPPMAPYASTPGAEPGVLDVRWEEGPGVAHVAHPGGLTLATSEDVARWAEQLFEKLAQIEAQRGGRFPIVVCVDGLVIRPSAADAYGDVARRYRERFATNVARYSRKPNGVGQIIAAIAMRQGYRANLFTSKSEAVAHVLGKGEDGAPRRRS